jgi:hypothetical protein
MTRTRCPIPEDREADVVRRLYKQVADLDWMHITHRERTRAYQSWTEDSQIGGLLLPFLSTEQNVRVWLKNGPIKEYPRALYGVGKYASCVARPATPVQSLVSQALGPGWIVDSNSLTIKPLMVTIRNNMGCNRGPSKWRFPSQGSVPSR